MRPALFLAAATIALLACGNGERSLRAGEATSADVIAGTVAAFEHFESAGGHFALELPAEWRGNFTVDEQPDSLYGAHYTVKFSYRPAPGSKELPKTLIVIRVFSTAAWEKVTTRPGTPPAAKIGAKGDVIYTASFPAGNPYPKGSPDAALFDKMVLGVIQDPAGVRLTPR